MSQENVEIVRHVYESGLFDRSEELLKLATPDIEYVNPPYAVEPGVRRGLVAVAQAMRRFAEGWEESRHELRKLYDCGDVVVAAVNWHIRGRGSERASRQRRGPQLDSAAGQDRSFRVGAGSREGARRRGRSGVAVALSSRSRHAASRRLRLESHPDRRRRTRSSQARRDPPRAGSECLRRLRRSVRAPHQPPLVGQPRRRSARCRRRNSGGWHRRLDAGRYRRYGLPVAQGRRRPLCLCRSDT